LSGPESSDPHDLLTHRTAGFESSVGGGDVGERIQARDDWNQISALLNNRPRRTLHWHTAAETLNRALL